jgi:hypothetical protein
MYVEPPKKTLSAIDFIHGTTEREAEKARNRAERKAQLDADLKSGNPQLIKHYSSMQFEDKMSKARDQQLANLANTIVRSRRGVGYKPNLAYREGADQFLLDHPGYVYRYGDFDNNINTPDNILILDDRGNPHYIDGYYLRDDNMRRGMAAAVGPMKSTRAYKTMSKLEKRLFNQFVKENWQTPNNINDANYKQWLQYYMRKHPNVGTITPMHGLQKTISDKIKVELDKVGLLPKDVRFIEMQSHILSNLIEQAKKDYGVSKLTTLNEWESVEDAFNAIDNWPELIQTYALRDHLWNVNIKDYYLSDAEARRTHNLGFNSERGKYEGTHDRTKPIRVWEPKPKEGSSSSASAPPPPLPFYEQAYRSPTRLQRSMPAPPYSGDIPSTEIVSRSADD